MSRWLVLTVFSMLPLIGGCGTAVRPGLANAPRLGGTAAADDRITDVVSNGADACGLYTEHGVLRNQVPACASWAPARAPASYAAPSATTEPNGGLVEPWVNHLYAGWPCPRTAWHQTKSWSVPGAVVASCAVP